MRGNIDDPDGGRPELFGIHEGVVTHRDDPDKLGRVRVRIPGVIEPASSWAWPIGVPGGASNDRGLWWIPEVGAEVAVWFKSGDPDHPRYMPSHWGSGEVPEASGGDPDVVVLAFGDYDLIVDRRSGAKSLKIVDKAAGDNALEFDGLTRTLSISATTGIQIQSTGQIDIQGLVVTINGIVAGSGQL